MSLNRFLLAALSASLPHTIDSSEYMVANSVVPTVGPAGVLIGAGVGTALRLVLGPGDARLLGERDLVRGGRRPASCSVRGWRYGFRGVSWGRRVGPDPPARRRRRARGGPRPTGGAATRRARLLTIGAHRIIYGIVTVATILVYRNYFHRVDEVEPAIADLGLLVVVTGAASSSPPWSRLR